MFLKHQLAQLVPLKSKEVHVWCAHLMCDSAQIYEYSQSLGADELQRAHRFHFHKDQNRYVVARGVLRAILGSYLNCGRQNVQFGYSPHGKPFLSGKHEKTALRFNLSHSDELALYAFTLDSEIGVDIERIRFDFEIGEIAQQFFSAKENEDLVAVKGQLKYEAFFNCWTRKEAYIKARGEGLSLPLHEFDVSLAPGEPTALLNCRTDSREVSRWSLSSLNPAEGYKAALAVEGKAWELKCWNYSE